jgi:hypothetical protein
MVSLLLLVSIVCIEVPLLTFWLHAIHNEMEVAATIVIMKCFKSAAGF